MTENLILLGKTPSQTTMQKLHDMFTQLMDCGIILMEDATNLLYTPAILENWKIPIMAVQEDIEARGHQEAHIPSYISLISYTGIIQQIAEAGRIISML